MNPVLCCKNDNEIDDIRQKILKNVNYAKEALLFLITCSKSEKTMVPFSPNSLASSLFTIWKLSIKSSDNYMKQSYIHQKIQNTNDQMYRLEFNYTNSVNQNRHPRDCNCSDE